MIPPDYTALEMKARFCASRRRASGGYTLAEFLEESADALALAASLQDEIARLEKLKERYRLDCLYHAECRPNRRQAEAAMADAKAVNDAMADEIAKNRALQDEIERLKGYVRHAPDCHIATDGNGEYTNCYRPLGGCSCGLTPETGAT